MLKNDVISRSTSRISNFASGNCGLHVNGQQVLVIGDGLGGMLLINPSVQGESKRGQLVYPLNLKPPQVGRISFVIATAFALEGSSIFRVIIWSLLSKTCQLHCVTCQLDSDIQIKVLATAQLMESTSPPYLVLCNGVNDQVLVGVTLIEAQDTTDKMHTTEENDPRSLEQAAAQMQAGDRVGQSFQDYIGYVDMYKEAGPEEIGAPGQEPKIELLLTSGQHQTNFQNKICWQLQISPQRIIQTQNNAVCLTKGFLALTNDVDCEIIEAQLVDKCDTPQLQHLYSIPALAYVASGKTQKKYVLMNTKNANRVVGKTVQAIISQLNFYFQLILY
eukprot:TRINITY_DN5745_c1_g1_i1.p1 TRINITY_DN5745_c1_g1~~TRINITY_DN5745_c1_g1_i1.p1  ORF type:complete len:333 (+),score=33.48 TRINITY_DN5745_c1_g1_i1:59-1057(+)